MVDIIGCFVFFSILAALVNIFISWVILVPDSKNVEVVEAINNERYKSYFLVLLFTWFLYWSNQINT